VRERKKEPRPGFTRNSLVLERYASRRLLINATKCCVNHNTAPSQKQQFFALKDKKRYTPSMRTHHPREAPDLTQRTTSEAARVRRRSGGRSARVQAAVFEATLHLLEEKGYEALSFATIAERAQINKTSLYRRWNTKEQLVLDAVESRVTQEFPLPDTGTLCSDLILLVQYLRTFLQSVVGQTILQMAIASKQTPSVSSFLKDYWQHRYPSLRPLFDRAIARGELSPQADLQLLFETLLGILYVRAFLLREPLDEPLPEGIVDLVLHGVCVSLPKR
jgi:AcrR family transcriptional regulator